MSGIRARLAAALAAVILLGGCSMQSSSTGHKNVTETVLAEADAWLAEAGETGYTLGVCTRKEDSWYVVEVDGGEKPDYQVFVRLTTGDSEIRDDRVLDSLSREMTGMAAAIVPEGALCAAFVSFGTGIPERAWNACAPWDEVSAAETLRTDWYLLMEQTDALARAAADLAVDMTARGCVGTLHAAVLSADELDRLQAAGSDRPGLVEAAGEGAWIRVQPKDTRSRDEWYSDILRELTDG